ncbi:MAG TPA: right-handed parallel beta-helix repeat-containing protein [Anaeromyxobacter sp.]|nr:right-handed parallel beta-helix repeat-containing protein [Anaeromyxobacter sp.]
MTRPRRSSFLRSFDQVLLLSVLAAASCDRARTESEPPARRLEIHPATTSLRAETTVSFTGTVAGAAVTGVQWSASAGSITSGGVYTAPAQLGSYRIDGSYEGMTASATVHVVAPGTPADLHAVASATCADMPLRSTGTIHYFCDCQSGAQPGCVAGDDANDGLSPARPRRRWYAAIQAFNAMDAGDTVALCKGGAWSLDVAIGTCGQSDPGAGHDSGSAYLQNPRCAAGSDLTDARNASTCDLRDYQAGWGGTHKPLLAIPASVTAPTLILGRNGASTSGVRVMNLEFRGNGRGPGGGTYNDNTGMYWGSCGPTTDTSWLVCNNTFDRLMIGLHMDENGATATHMNVWGNRILSSWLDGLLGGPGAYSKLDANFWDNNGGWGSPRGPAHTIYPNGKDGSPGAQIVNNEIRYSAVTCVNAIISGHGAWNGLNVENNLIDCGANPVPGCWAMKLDSGNASGNPPHYQRNAHVHRNTIYASSAGIGLGQAPGSVVENNVIVMVGGTTDWKRGILIPSEPSFGWDVTSNVAVRNNTIHIPMNDANAAGIQLGWEGERETGHVIANNVVDAGGSLTTCFATPHPAGGYAFVGNNACHRGTWGTVYDATPHVTADPAFTNAPLDFTPRPGSPLVGGGTAAHAPAVDFTLEARPSTPSIGAYEP